MTQPDPAAGLIVDGHVDVAWNALYNGRDLARSVPEIRAAEFGGDGTVALTSLRSFGAANVAIVFATLFAEPAAGWGEDVAGLTRARPARRYRTPEEAEEAALEMLDLYEAWAAAGLIRIIADRPGLEDHLRRFRGDRVPGFVIIMEGADPIRAPEDLPAWFARGLRMVGLTWASTRYAGGTGSSEPLTDLGRELLTQMAAVGIAHDVSHLSEEAFWEAAGLPHHALCASHANARALMLPPPGHRTAVPLNRHLSDAQIAEVARPHGVVTRGVIGLALLNDFLDPRWDFDAAGRAVDVTMARQGAAHLRHLADIAGWGSVGLGTDIDAGYGRDETPREIDSVADWARIADPVPAAERDGVLGLNWLRFLREVLPGSGTYVQ